MDRSRGRRRPDAVPKTHHTAVAVVPPPEVWEPIQAIRRQHDRQIRRWMPHINLLYPFVPRPHFPTAESVLCAAMAPVAPLHISLDVVRAFTHGSGSATLWLAPEPREALVRLQAILQDAFPAYDDLSRFAGGFTPHLSVGQAPSAGAAEQLRQALQATWRPLQFTLNAVALIWRDADSPFQVARWIPLHS